MKNQEQQQVQVSANEAEYNEKKNQEQQHVQVSANEEGKQ